MRCKITDSDQLINDMSEVQEFTFGRNISKMKYICKAIMSSLLFHLLTVAVAVDVFLSMAIYIQKITAHKFTKSSTKMSPNFSQCPQKLKSPGRGQNLQHSPLSFLSAPPHSLCIIYSA